MKPEKYLNLKQFVIDSGFEKDIDWSESVSEPENAMKFFYEAGWVIVNSGMKNQIAEQIWKKIKKALYEMTPICKVFKHPGKADAIEYLWKYKKTLYLDYINKKTDEEKLEFLETLPWIGPITKWHLAKNFGMNVCKPDRHLVRIAEKYDMTPEEMCKSLAEATGDRIATVDYVIWRAANLGKI